MPESTANDELLMRLGAARPSIPADEFRPDGAQAIALLNRILAVDAGANEDIALRRGGTEVVHASSEASPVATPAHRARRRIAAALVAVVVLVLATVGAISGLNHGRDRLSARGGTSWKLTGLILQPAWHVQPTVGSDPLRVDCPSATTCYAIGFSTAPTASGADTLAQGLVEVTLDGGTTWHQSLLPSVAATTGSITCPAIDTCMLAGPYFADGVESDVMFTTNDGGQTWSTLPIPRPKNGGPLVLSCATVLNCDSLQSVPGPGGLGLRYVSNVTTDGGHTWASSFMPGTFRAYALQCAAPDYCIVGGYEPGAYRVSNPAQNGPAATLYSSDGGVTWNAGTIPTALPDGNVQKISCSDSSHCMAISNSVGPYRSYVLVTSDGGQTWSLSPGALPGLNLGAISCPTASDCWVSGSTLPIVGDNLDNLQGIIYSTHDAAQSWSSEQVPTYNGAPLGYIGGLACAAASSCLGVANATTSPVLGQEEVISNTGGTS